MRQTADAIVATGLAAAGYQYGLFFFFRFISFFSLFLFIVNIDDFWQASRDTQGTIQADPHTFPTGIPALIDYVHSKKLKFGLYSGNFVVALY
jgi:alpha-galactosidase